MRFLAEYEQHPRGIFAAPFTALDGSPIMYAVDRCGRQVECVTLRDGMTEETAEAVLEQALQKAEEAGPACRPALVLVRGGLH